MKTFQSVFVRGISKAILSAGALLAVTSHAQAAEQSFEMARLDVRGAAGFADLRLVGKSPEGQGPENLTEISIKTGLLTLAEAKVTDLETCAPGSPALLTPNGRTLSNLMDHPKVNLAESIAAIGGVDLSGLIVNVNCGELDSNGNRTLLITSDWDDTHVNYGVVQFNPETSEWEFHSLIDGKTYSDSTHMTLSPRQCRFQVGEDVYSWEGSNCPQSSNQLGEEKPSIPVTPGINEIENESSSSGAIPATG